MINSNYTQRNYYSIILINIWALVVFLIMPLNEAKAQITPDFEANRTSGCAPFLVQFQNLTNNIDNYTYVWDFGNGNTSTNVHPATTYTQPGSYTVSLTISNGGSSTTLTKEDYIVIYSPPNVDFSPDVPIAQCTPMEALFEASITPLTKTYNYLWDFGDGNQTTEATPSHTYTFPGTYNVTLIVEDENGCGNRITKENIITAQKPSAIFNTPNTRACNGELNVSFNNESYGNSSLNYTWYFGDNTTSQLATPTHLYSSDGTFDVSLKATDNLGCTDSITLPEYITVSSTTAGFSNIKDTICINEKLEFTNTSINNRKNNWDFGDNQSSSNISPSHSYATGGDYTVELTIENYDCSDSYSKNIHVENLNIDFTPSVSYACEIPVDVTYEAIGDDNIVSYAWNFGNGHSSSQKKPINTFDSDEALAKDYYAEYSDTLEVTSKHGCKAKATKNKSVVISLPKVNILSDNATGGCTPLTVSLNSKVDYQSSTDNVTNYKWLLGSQEVSTEESYSTSLSNIGTHNVKLIIETALGCEASKLLPLTVGEKHTPDFSVKDKNIFCANEYVEFIDETESNGNILSNTWDFGDESNDPFPVPYHQYADTGYMDVSLIVSHNGCKSSITKEDIVYINGPIASFTRTGACESPMLANIELDLLDAENYTFDFNDGTIISNQGNLISHTYDSKGEYETVLTATKDACTYTYNKTIYIAEPKAIFDTIATSPCINQEIVLDPSLSEDGDFFVYEGVGKLYLWDFGDGSPLEFTDTQVTHKYKTKGNYTISLVIKDKNDCADTLKKSINIYHPSVEFTSDYVNGCLPVVFKFTDQTTSDNTINSWNWNFGDGNSSTTQSPNHSYNNFGNYDVTLSVQDNRGCLASKKLNQEIKVVQPDASFKVSDANACLHDSIEFIDTSLSNIESFHWDFGDGNTSSLRIPKHTYKNKGKYDITFEIVDDHGCVKSLSKPSFIDIQEPPIAQFSSPITESNCYPFSVQFINETNYESSGTQKWTFGDNLTGSDLSTPNHIYTKPDLYDVTLIAYSSNGCADTLTKEHYVEIRGPYAEISLADTACIYNDISFSLENERNISSVIWDFGDGNTSDRISANHTYNRKGMHYPLILLNSSGSYNCEKVVTDSILISRVKADYTFKDDKFEGCIPLNLEASNQSLYASNYNWLIANDLTSTETDPSLDFINDGDFEVKLISGDNFGCFDTIQKTVTTFPLPTITTHNDTFICVGDNIEIWAQGGISYKWDNEDLLDNANIDFPIATPIETTDFSVMVTDANHCTDTDHIKVTVQQQPNLELNDSTIIIGESIQVDVAKNDLKNYTWTPNSNISCSNCPNPILRPLDDTQYTVSVTDTSDCFTNDFYTNIIIQKKYSVNVPDAFTPNNDGANEIIFVKGWGIKELVYFRVFNRYGQLIFETKDINEGWNGSFKGKPQIADIYNYVVKVKTYENDYLENKGNIKLIR